MAEKGYFVWYELMTTDMKAAEAFYTKVVGWDAADAGMPEVGMDYTLFSAGAGPVAGLMILPEEAKAMGTPPCWTGYIGVPNVDEAAKTVVAKGGKIYREPTDIPSVGRFAVVSDPYGAAFCLFTPLPGQDWEPAAPATPGYFGWHELYAGDGPKAFDFYSEMFGWELSSDFDMGPMGKYKIFKIGDRDFGGIMTKPAEMPMPAWNFYINVPAIDAAITRITEGGGAIANGPMEVPGGSWIVQATDPQGAFFSLVAPAR
ncbi:MULTISPECIES: VOC family protein [unclassified Rhizobium]|uniref:VOC family protein n=1 Tax=unclassified Rhizobium TaxID=2613769 RepID=UPI000EA97354|nr:MULTISPECIES: VOC family protein [unclassified Rhizobium]AYG65531.1 VOC family protein [Rhizobium sp. CCGE531]AYG72013.1 VOC family protein [Rhizobium sp. CCGE532]